MKNVLKIQDRASFRAWLKENGEREKECFIVVKRGKPTDDGAFYYLDAVEEALCFGWIDSTTKPIDGVNYQRFSPRVKNGNWTELNKERVRRLEKLGLMTDRGRAVLPKGFDTFVFDEEVVNKLKEQKAWDTFCSFPPLYQRVRVSNIVFYRKHLPEQYEKALFHLIEMTKKCKTYGEWNDYGRLTDD